MSKTTAESLSEATAARTVLFVINVDWFFVSHFLPFVAEARRRGYRCCLACEITGERARLEAAGVEVFPLALSRGARSLGSFWRAARGLARLIEAQAPQVVHAIGLEAVTTAALGRLWSPRAQFVFAPTGLGYAALRSGLRARALGRVFPMVLGRSSAGRVGWIFENEDDPATFGLVRKRRQGILIVGGAGVDLEAFRPTEFPARPPLRVAQVSRMIRSKGPDLAVEAVAALRRAGHPVELTLVGDPDAFNPHPVPQTTLQQWNDMAGVRWTGRQQDIPAVWASHHVACLPSRGGEGLPKSLIEAAACGRAIVTTDVPGCRALVRDGIEGFVVPTESAEALAVALQRLLDTPGLVAKMGHAARQRAVSGYSDRQVAARVVDYYERLLAAAAKRRPS